MSHRMAGWDRALRIVVGAVILFLGWPGILMMTLGLILLASGVTGWGLLHALNCLKSLPRDPTRPAQR